MSMKGFFKFAAAVLSILLILTALPACSGGSEVPDGYQYATCTGEYFRLFVPTQWKTSTGSGISGATLTINSQKEQIASVTMKQIPFSPTEEDGTPVAEPTLDRFLSAYTAEVSALYDYEETDPALEDKIDDHRAVRLSYRARVGGTMYRFRQVLCKVEGRFYVFSFDAPEDVYDTEMGDGSLLDIVGDIQDNIRIYAQPYEGGEETLDIPSDVKTPDGMKLISTDHVAFRFFVPTAWENDMENQAFLAWTTETDGSRSNVSMLTYMPAYDGYSVDDYWTDMCDEPYRNTLPSFALLSMDDEGEPGGEAGKLGDRDAKLYTYTYELGGNHYKTRQAVCVYATSIYVLTYTTLEQHFDSHLAEVDAMQAAVVFRSPFRGE